MKREVPAFKQIEKLVWRAIAERFQLREEDATVKEADLRALVTEMRDLWVGRSNSRSKEVPPFEERIVPVGPRAARYLFLKRYEELTGDRVLTRRERVTGPVVHAFARMVA